MDNRNTGNDSQYKNRPIKSISDLPNHGKAIIISKETHPLYIAPGLRDFMAIYGLSDVPEQSDLKETVWLLVKEGFEGELHFNALKNRVRKEGHTIERIAKIDVGLMKVLYESSSKHGAEDNSNNELIMYFTKMIEDALTEKVSDIHIEKRASKSNIRMRKHGELLEYGETSAQYAQNLCSVIYNVLAENQDVQFMEDEYQAAAVDYIVKNTEVKLRYQSLPVYPGGFDVVLRVLPIGSDDESFVDLSDLGYAPTQVKTLIDIISKPVGGLIIAGTTGSGKSTTLKNLLMFSNAAHGYRSKIYTIEDPPEYKIPKVSQIPVVRRKNEDYTKKSPFEDPLIATMRADPDILMIGEIRDKFTGDGLKKATQSGHQVMTTVHAASALGIIERLSDFGITPSVMGSPEFLTGLVYQKLMPTLCQECSVSLDEAVESANVSKELTELSQRVKEVTESRHIIKIRKEGGCAHCNNLGVVGRQVCAEIIAPDFQLLHHFREQDAIGAYAYWRTLSDNDMDSNNMIGKTALEHALVKMRKGLISPIDIEVGFGPVNGAKKMLEQIRKDNQRKNKGAKNAKGNQPVKDEQDFMFDNNSDEDEWELLQSPE